MNKMVPVPVIRSEGRRFLPMTNSKRRPHSLAFYCSQLEASFSWSSFVREDCLPETEEEVLSAAIWWAYQS